MKLDFLGWAERFVATPSVSRDGNREISERAAELLREVGLEPRFCAAEGQPEQRNVVADVVPAGGEAVGAQGDGGLLLLTHLDTVPPGDPEQWTATGGDPFRPTRYGDLLYGLGSADAKLDFVAKVAALADVDRAALRGRLRIVGTFGEEIGLRGARHLVRTGGTRGFRFALVGEPSELWATVAHKGYGVFEARLPHVERTAEGEADRVREEYDGVAAHSSTPHLGKNAIEAALERCAAAEVVGIAALEGGGAVNQVPDRCRVELYLGRKGTSAGYPKEPLLAFHGAWRAFVAGLREPRDARFDPDHSVASLGRAEVRDGRPVFHFDLRPVPGAHALPLASALEDVAEIECVRRNPPLATPESSPLVEAVVGAQLELGLGRRVGTKSTCTEAGLLSEAGLEAIVIGAGTSVGNVHRPNEHTRVSELLQLRELYAHVIRRLCGGGG